MLTLVKFYDELADLFCPEIELFLSCPADLIGLMDANFDGKFSQYLKKHGEDFFEIIVNGIKRLQLIDCTLPLSMQILEMSPVIQGSKGGVLVGILGLGLLAVGGLGFGLLGFSATQVAVFGGLIAFKGFFGAKKNPKQKNNNETRRSDLFQGSSNSSGVQAIPTVCGWIRTGSINVSLDVTTRFI